MGPEKKNKIILIPCKVTGHSFAKFLKQLYLDTGYCKLQLIIYYVMSCKKHGFNSSAHLFSWMFCLEYFQNIGDHRNTYGNNSATNTWCDSISHAKEARGSQENSYSGSHQMVIQDAFTYFKRGKKTLYMN